MSKKNIINKPLMGVFKSGQWISIPDTMITKNGIDEINLRGWQGELLEIASESELPHLFINCPTGAGKSKAALAVVVDAEQYTNKLVIVSAPQKEIGKGFLSSEGNPQKILDHTWLINPANQLCENYYKNEDGNVARLKEFLMTARSKDLNERILICCHATLAILFDKLSDYEKKKYLMDIKLCIDESHHSFSQEDASNGLGKVVNYFLKHSNQNLDLVMMTATPFRGDRGSLIPDQYMNQFCRYDLDYGRHFEENCSGLEFVYNAVLHNYGENYRGVIEQLMTKYLDRGDKVLVQIPPSNRDISNGKFVDLQMTYDAIGKKQQVDENGVVNIKKGDRWIRIIDLVTEKDREKRLNYLRKNHDNIDVVVGISMIKEGFDWPPANAGILIGQQGSLNAQIQLMGRMFRAYSNKGRDNGQKPVEISQVFPYVDHEKLDEDETREQINDFMKIVYAALAMELVINPIYINLPTKNPQSPGNGLPRRDTVKDYLTDNLTDTQYTDLISSVIDDYRDWKVTADEDDDCEAKIEDIVVQKLVNLGIDEYHKEISQFFVRTLQRAAKFQLAAVQGMDVSHIDINLMADLDDPIESIIMGMSNGLCGASDIREFQLLMQPIDTLRRCHEVKEWVKINKEIPPEKSKDPYIRSLGIFCSNMRKAYKGKGTNKITQEHIDILESIDGWRWDFSDKTLEKCHEVKEHVKKTKEIPPQNSEDPYIRSLGRFCSNMRRAYHGKGNTKITQEHIDILESIDGWRWDFSDKTIEKCHEVKEHVKKTKEFPPITSEDPYIRSLGIFCSNMRRAYHGKGRYKITQEHIDILESIDGWRWDKTLEKCHEVKEHVKKTKEIPSKNSKDPYIRSLGIFCSNMRRAYKGKGNNKITQEHIDILESIDGWYWSR